MCVHMHGGICMGTHACWALIFAYTDVWAAGRIDLGKAYYLRFCRWRLLLENSSQDIELHGKAPSWTSLEFVRWLPIIDAVYKTNFPTGKHAGRDKEGWNIHKDLFSGVLCLLHWGRRGEKGLFPTMERIVGAAYKHEESPGTYRIIVTSAQRP